MTPWWVTFEDGTNGCVEGQGIYDAAKIAEHVTGKTVKRTGEGWEDYAVERLPYPANPIIWQFDHPIHGACPAFCFTPKECVGKSACPRNRACDD